MHEGITLKDVATQVGITERAVLGIIQDLDEADYLTRHKVGRSNRYKINLKKPLRHPLESNVKIQDLVKVLTKAQSRLNHK